MMTVLIIIINLFKPTNLKSDINKKKITCQVNFVIFFKLLENFYNSSKIF